MVRFHGLLKTKQVLASTSLRNRASICHAVHALTQKSGTSVPCKGTVSPVLRALWKLFLQSHKLPVSDSICPSTVSRCQCWLWHCVCSDTFLMHAGHMPGFKPMVSMPLLLPTYEARCNCCRKKVICISSPVQKEHGLARCSVPNVRAKSVTMLFFQSTQQPWETIITENFWVITNGRWLNQAYNVSIDADIFF